VTPVQIGLMVGAVTVAGIMLSDRGRGWIFGRCTNKYLSGDVAVFVHYVAWTLAMVKAFKEFGELGSSFVLDQSDQWTIWLVFWTVTVSKLRMIWVCFGIVTAFQQFTVMRDFQEMKKSVRALRSDYGTWIDMRAEVILRWTIVVALYVGVGEFFRIPGVVPLDQFKYGALIVFLACMVWNIGALVIARRLASNTARRSDSMRGTHQSLLVLRLWFFIFSCVFAAGYWLSAIYSDAPIGAALLLFIYVFFMVAIIALRFTYVRAKVVFWRHEASVTSRRMSREEHKLWKEEIEQIYSAMIERANQGQYTATCGSIAIKVLPEVYAPGFFSDSMWFAEKLSTLVRHRSVLEIGTGTGLIAISAVRNGATRCVATDINPHALKNAILNVQDAGLGGQIDVRGGNVYEKIDDDERFDIIFWAHPFNWTRKKIKSPLRLSGMDYRYKGLEAYVEGAKQHVERNGRILLGTGDSADVVRLIRFALKNRFDVRVLCEEEIPLRVNGTQLVRLYLCELVEWN
jgi:methylase of polypeptide subunit release factors